MGRSPAVSEHDNTAEKPWRAAGRAVGSSGTCASARSLQSRCTEDDETTARAPCGV